MCIPLYIDLTHSNILFVATGVGRIIAEAKSIPTVIPFWHVGKSECYVVDFCASASSSTGMDDILPNRAPYIPSLFKVPVSTHLSVTTEWVQWYQKANKYVLCSRARE